MVLWPARLDSWIIKEATDLILSPHNTIIWLVPEVLDSLLIVTEIFLFLLIEPCKISLPLRWTLFGRGIQLLLLNLKFTAGISFVCVAHSFSFESFLVQLLLLRNFWRGEIKIALFRWCVEFLVLVLWPNGSWRHDRNGVHVFFCFVDIIFNVIMLPWVQMTLVKLRVRVGLCFMLKLHVLLIALICDVVLGEGLLMLLLRLCLMDWSFDKVVVENSFAPWHTVIVLVTRFFIYLMHVAVGLKQTVCFIMLYWQSRGHRMVMNWLLTTWLLCVVHWLQIIASCCHIFEPSNKKRVLLWL